MSQPVAEIRRTLMSLPDEKCARAVEAAEGPPLPLFRRRTRPPRLTRSLRPTSLPRSGARTALMKFSVKTPAAGHAQRAASQQNRAPPPARASRSTRSAQEPAPLLPGP